MRREHFICVALLLVGFSAGAEGTPRAQAAETFEGECRFVRYDGPFAYGLVLRPPWPDGGKLVVNLPEHLEYMPGTRGILRYNDKAPKGRWEISDDGRTAILDVDSSTVANVHVKGVGRVVAPNRVEITMTIANNRPGGRVLGAIRPLYCFHYRRLAGFPRWIDNFKHCYVLVGGKPTTIAEAPKEKMQTKCAGATVVGCTQTGDMHFAERAGGLIEKGIDAALVAVAQMKGNRKLVFGWTPGKSLLSNANIPCIHADPFYGDIKPGESKTAKCVVVFSERPLAELFNELRAEGVGAPRRQD